MKTQFVTRAQYDWLVDNCGAWLSLRWKEFSKNWGSGGVTVTAPAHKIENLNFQLAGMNQE